LINGIRSLYNSYKLTRSKPANNQWSDYAYTIVLILDVDDIV